LSQDGLIKHSGGDRFPPGDHQKKNLMLDGVTPGLGA
jgi:hypothetical protein